MEVLGRRVGTWKILLSPQALKSIQYLGRSGNFAPIENNLRNIASGSWSYRIAGGEQQRKKLRVPLAITRCNLHVFILWQIDVAMDETTQTKAQLVKVWQVGTKEEVNGLIDRVAVIQQSYSADQVVQSRQKPLQGDDKNSIPRLFPITAEDSAGSGVRTNALDIRTVDREVLELANRAYALTEPMVRSVLANDLWGEFPYDFSADETRAILNHDTSSLILGRSGTGKTTCLVFQLLAKYAAGCSTTEVSPPRQVLLTRSTGLAEKLKSYLQRLRKTLIADVGLPPDLPGADLGEDTCVTFFELPDSSFPLVCTFGRFLGLLEGTVDSIAQEGFPRRNDEENDAASQQDESSDDLNEPQELLRLWQRPRNDVGTQYVDFQSFKLDYWPRFPADLVKDLPVELIFSEFIGVIKGSFAALESLQPLSRETYLQLSARSAPNFTLLADRHKIYDLFVKYQALKLKRGELDDVDRSVRLIRAVRDDVQLGHYLSDRFDEVYVDEIQDLRCLDIELLLSMVNKGRAFTFAGDTAQTISQDSHFRFQDIKALFFTHFTTIASLTNQEEIARPQLFMLPKNYRSHQGILGLASLVMDMLWNGFPDAVDKLMPEVGHIRGPLPIFFLGCDTHMLSSDGTDEAQSERTLDFGAEQVIIVRDEITKAKVVSELHEKALVLTVLESKGMEFEDVFLWNFFTDSPWPVGWRHLADLKTKVEGFLSKKHVGMCSELKQFYVAITRARVRLSIIESEVDPAAQIADVLKHETNSPLVEIMTPADPHFLQDLVSLKSPSHDAERWSERGQDLMQRMQYGGAALCFRRANDHRGQTWAAACICEADARRSVAVNDNLSARGFFLAAIKNFKELGMIDDVIRNLVRIGQYKEAAETFVTQEKPSLAAPLFARAGLFKRAADQYHQALNYDNAAAAFQQGGHGQELFSYVVDNRQHLSHRAFEIHRRFCFLQIRQNRLCHRSLGPALKNLATPSEREQIYKEYKMLAELAELYAEEKRFRERFQLHFRAGKLDLALKEVKNLRALDTEALQDVIHRVQNYYFAGQVIGQSSERINVPAPFQASNAEWREAQKMVLQNKGRSLGSKQIETCKAEMVRNFLGVQTLLRPKSLHATARLEDMPLEAIWVASEAAEAVSLQNVSIENPLVLLIAGVMAVGLATEPFVLLSWSPIRDIANDFDAAEYPRLANEWFLTQVGCTMLEVDWALRRLWDVEWPMRCSHFLTHGSCRDRLNHTCRHSHTKVHEVDCRRKLSTLIEICRILCSFSVTHGRGVMGQGFQEQFFKLRRFWMESLIRELTFVSSFEQCSHSITTAKYEIFCLKEDVVRKGKRSVLAANLESLLFYKLAKRGDQRTDLSSCFELLQISQIFDWKMQGRFAEYLCGRLSYLPATEFQQDKISALRQLEHDLEAGNASVFRDSLNCFTRNLHLADADAYIAFHSVTAIFEYFTAYLISRCCRSAFLLPQSWIDFHLPWFVQALDAQPTCNLTRLEVDFYAGSLLHLLTCFSQILVRQEDFSGTGFSLGLRTYPFRLLHRRNAELLALGLVNLSFCHPLLNGIGKSRETISQVFGLPHIRVYCLQHQTVAQLLDRLIVSHQSYGNKDHLRLVKNTNAVYGAEGRIRMLGVRVNSIAEVLSTIRKPRQPSQEPLSTKTATHQSDHQHAVATIERFWSSQYPMLLQRRAFLNTPLGRLYAQFSDICSQGAASKLMRILLTGRGVQIHHQLRVLSETASKQQEAAIELLVNVPQDEFDHANQTVELVTKTNASLEEVADAVSTNRIRGLVGGEVAEVKSILGSVESMLVELTDNVDEVARMMGEIGGKVET